MKLEETKELLDWLSAVDNRRVTAEKVKAWNEVIGYLSFEDAKQAAIQAKREVEYVEPHNIVSFVRELDRKTGTNRNKEHTQALIAEDDRRARERTPMPKCIHGKGLLLCDPCCRNAAIQAGLIKG